MSKDTGVLFFFDTYSTGMKLLRLKHWQLFLITFVVPFVAYLIGIISFAVVMVRGSIAGEKFGYQFVPQVKDFIPLIVGGAIMLAGVITHYVWMYSAATRLQAYMHPDMRKLKVKRFRIFFFSPFLYLLLMGILLPVLFSFQPDQHTPPAGPFITIIIVIILGHSYSAFCMIYVLYFSAKTVKSAELQREAHFSDYIGEFFMFWFFPVGVWFLQPKINKIIGRSDTEFESAELLEQ